MPNRNNKSKRNSTKMNSKPSSKQNKTKRDLNERIVNTDSKHRYINSVMESTNDFSWYNKNPKLIDDVGNVSFYNQLGAKFAAETTVNNQFSMQVPGLMVFEQVTTPGYTNSPNDAPSLAAIQEYDYVRSKLNKPNPDYEAQDMFMVKYAIADLYSQYTNILRMFAIAHTWSGDNLYTPRTYLRGLYHMQPQEIDDLYTNEANLRMKFNYLITKASSFLFLPEGYSIVDRQAWLFGSLFTDHDSNKSQVYAYRKSNYWKFSETLSSEGTAVEYKSYDAEAPHVNYYLNIFNSCIEALRSSDLVRTVLSDVRQAYSDKNVLAMAYLDERYSIQPTYDPVALAQIENMDILDDWSSFTNRNITQNVTTNNIVFMPRCPDNAMVVNNGFIEAGSKIINLHKAVIEKSDIVEATRGKIVIKQMEDSTDHVIVTASDFCVGAFIYSGFIRDEDEVEFKQTYADDGDLSEFALNVMPLWVAFDWAPHINVVIDGDTEVIKRYTMYEYDHYTSIGPANVDGSVLQRLNTVCALSLWSVPEQGFFKP